MQLHITVIINYIVFILYCGFFRLSYDETDDDLERWDDEAQDITLDTGQLVWALAFGSNISHTKRHSTSLNWSSGHVTDLLLATGLQSGCIKIWHVRSRKYAHPFY